MRRLAKGHAKVGLLLSLLVLSAGGYLSLATPAVASQARYVLEKCDPALPGGGVEGATFHGSAPFSGAQNCAENGSIFVVQQGDVSTSSAYWTLPLPPPPGGYTESVTVTGSMCAGAYQDAGTVAYAVGGGWAPNCQTQTHTFQMNSVTGDPGLVYLGCEGSCVGAPEAWAADFAATEVDPVAPKVSAIAGSLLDGAPARGHQTLSAIAGDEGGGISVMNLRVDGQPLEASRPSECATVRVSNRSYSGVAAIRAVPCPPKTEASWTLDTAAPPFHDGVNSVSVCAQDFSTIGPANEGCSSRSFVVDNSCAESPVLGGDVLHARFVRNKKEDMTVRYGRAAKVRGRLLDQNGAPVAGATICIQLATQGSRRGLVPVATTSTDVEGHFSFKIGAGPNRKLLVGYRHDSFQIERLLSIHTHARPRLHARPAELENGEWVKLAGALPEPRASRRVVVLQANVPGSRRWITFGKATTGRRGHFKARYHFTSTTRRIAYRFRAVVPQQAGYPWDQGASKPVRVVVTP